MKSFAFAILIFGMLVYVELIFPKKEKPKYQPEEDDEAIQRTMLI
jgi:hypothetical protein